MAFRISEVIQGFLLRCFIVNVAIGTCLSTRSLNLEMSQMKNQCFHFSIPKISCQSELPKLRINSSLWDPIHVDVRQIFTTITSKRCRAYTKELWKMIWNWVENIIRYTFKVDTGCENIVNQGLWGLFFWSVRWPEVAKSKIRGCRVNKAQCYSVLLSKLRRLILKSPSINNDLFSLLASCRKYV